MIAQYIDAALNHAEYRKLEDGTWFAEIPGLEGVWANRDTVETCRQELAEVVEEWLLLKIRDGDAIPTMGGVEIKTYEEALA